MGKYQDPDENSRIAVHNILKSDRKSITDDEHRSLVLSLCSWPRFCQNGLTEADFTSLNKLSAVHPEIKDDVERLRKHMESRGGSGGQSR